MQLKVTESYIETRELQVAVNAAIHLQKPLLVKGEPGSENTLLDHDIKKAFKKKVHS